MKPSLILFIFLLFVSSVHAQDAVNEYSWLVDLATKYPILLYVLSGLGSLMILAQVVVAITPTKKDDIWLEKAQKSFFWKLVDIVCSFAPIKKK